MRTKKIEPVFPYVSTSGNSPGAPPLRTIQKLPFAAEARTSRCFRSTMLPSPTTDAAKTFSIPVSAACFAGHAIRKSPYTKAAG